MTVNYFDYDELRAKALAPEATKEDRLNLWYWFDEYGMEYWDGESYDMDDGLRLFPHYSLIEDQRGEIVDLELVDAVIR